MAIWRGPGGPGDAVPDQANSAQLAENFANAAAASAASVLTSESNAAASAAAALVSESNASTSASQASSSESNVASSASAALASEQAAAASEANALASEQAAALSESNAASSESNAASSESNAASSEANALASEQAAALSESNAASSESNAAASEAKAQQWATEAEDVPVETSPSNLYSAFHWAQKAEDFANALVPTAPSILPSLNLDFANVKALDPRITFTRTTTATYYDGVTTAKAEENLLLRSQDYSATWTVTNLTPVTGKTAPDGTSTATEFTAGAANAVLTQGYTAIAGSYTFSVWLRRVTGTGTIEIAADNGTWTTKSITGTWARYDVTQTVAAGSKTAGVRIVTSGDAIEVWGAQLEQRSAVTAYTPTTTQAITNYIPVLQTAASGVARFDHNPTTGESLGLLVEEQRTNLLVQSEDFNTTWVKARVSVTTNTIVAPDGTLTGDKMFENTNNNTHFIAGSTSFTTANASVTISVYAKKAERSIIRLQGGGAANWGTAPSAYFNLDTGVVSQTDAGTTASITPVGNGWYRCVITGTTASSGVTNPGVNIYLVSTGTTVSYAGNGYDGVFLWGAQVEAGAFPTSYIATTSASATRNADAATMTGTNVTSWFSNAQGTLYAEVNPRVLAVTSGFQINDNTTSNRIRLATTSTSDQGTITTRGTAQATLDGGTPAANTSMKLAMSYAVNDFKLSLNGGTAATDTTGTVPVVNQLQIGAETTTIGNMTLKKIAYYPIAVTAAELQALTTI